MEKVAKLHAECCEEGTSVSQGVVSAAWSRISRDAVASDLGLNGLCTVLSDLPVWPVRLPQRPNTPTCFYVCC